MDEQIINAALTESEIQKINGLMQQLAQVTDTTMRVRIALADILQGAIARHAQIESEMAQETTTNE